MFLGQEILWKQMWEALHADTKFPGLSSESQDGGEFTRESGDIYARQETLKRSLLEVAASHEDTTSNASTSRVDASMPPAKRQLTKPSPASSIEGDKHGMSVGAIIGSALMSQFIEFYFDNFHHWIPILHVRRFRYQIQSEEGREKVIYILYALIAACICFVHDPRLADDGRKARVAESCR